MTFQPGDRVEFEGQPGTVISRDATGPVVILDGHDGHGLIGDSLLTYTARNVVQEHTFAYQWRAWHLRYIAAGKWFCFERWCGRELRERKVGTATECVAAFNTAKAEMEARGD